MDTIDKLELPETETKDGQEPHLSDLRDDNKLSTRYNYFINNTSLHGIRFLDGKFGTFDRIYWICILLASFIGLVVIFVYTINTYSNDAIAINIDTAYLNWNNIFPAISFCMFKARSRTVEGVIRAFVRKDYKRHNMKEPRGFDLYHQIMRYLFLTPIEPMGFPSPDCSELNDTCGIDIDTLKRVIIPHNCNQIFSDIQFNGRRFDKCDDIFKLQNTEVGTCFTANGAHFYDFDLKKLPMTYNRSALERKFSFYYNMNELYAPHIFIHSPEDFPNFNSKFRYELGSFHERLNGFSIKTIETENSVNTREESIEKRQCRFPDELWPSNATLPYSFATCLTYRRVQLELMLCNCTIHTSPIEYKSQYCNYIQSFCIKKHETAKKTLYHHHNVEPCVPSCTEMEIGSVGKYQISLEKEEDELSEEQQRQRQFFHASDTQQRKSMVLIEIQNAPAMRLIRNVSFSRLDFVVSIGGIFGLFFGASLLSLIEIIYLLFVRQIENVSSHTQNDVIA